MKAKCLLKLISIFLSIICDYLTLIDLPNTHNFLKGITKKKKKNRKNSCQLAKHIIQSVSVNLESSFCFVVNKCHGKLKIVIFVFNLLGWFEILWNWCMWSYIIIDSFEAMLLIENYKFLLIFIIKITLLIANRPSVFLQHEKLIRHRIW